MSKSNNPSIDFITGKVSDGFHSFDDLYMHRYLLFIALMCSNPTRSWRAKLHSDGSMFKDSFVAGMYLLSGDITYHLPIGMWHMLDDRGICTYTNAPHWDGHTPDDVLDRLTKWIATM